MLVASVATHRTVGAWLERARERTYKHLKEEVELVETMPVLHRGRCEGELDADGRCAACGLSVTSMGGAPLPPSDEEVKAWQSLESQLLSGALIDEALENEAVRMCEPSGKGRREIVFRVPQDVFTEFRMMEVAYQRAGFGGEFLSWLCREFWRTWRPSLGKSDKWEGVYRRDRLSLPEPGVHALRRHAAPSALSLDGRRRRVLESVELVSAVPSGGRARGAIEGDRPSRRAHVAAGSSRAGAVTGGERTAEDGGVKRSLFAGRHAALARIAHGDQAR